MPWSCYSFFGRNMAIFSLPRFTLLTLRTGFDQSPYLRVHAVPIHSSRDRFLHPVLARMLQVVMVPCEDLRLKAVGDDKPRITIFCTRKWSRFEGLLSCFLHFSYFRCSSAISLIVTGYTLSSVSREINAPSARA